MRVSQIAVALAVVLLAAMAFSASAEIVEYDLTVREEPVDITGKNVNAITINGHIPGPTLRFRESDSAVIHVHNELNTGTSIHWHGILVPPGMDGVPFISFPPIAAGSTFTYRFSIRQAGTYWYHSHSEMQEQEGMYGAIVIEPKEAEYQYDSEETVVLSDWTDEPAQSVLRQLKRGSEWYSIQKGAGQSLIGALRVGRFGDYLKRELLRMPPMDISDVAYDRFLANGRPQMSIAVNAGDTVRLRIVDGSATTYFHLQYAGGPIEVIAADGQDVVPFDIQRLLIAVAETYDVLVTVPDSGAYELRATTHDGSAFVSIWIGSGPHVSAPTIPRPDLYQMMGKLSFGRIFSLTPQGTTGMTDSDVKAGKFDKPGMMGMGGNMTSSHSSGNLAKMSMPGMQGMSMSDSTTTQSEDTASLTMAGMSDMTPDSGNDTSGMNVSMDDHTAHLGESRGSSAIDPKLYDGKRFGGKFLPLATDASSSRTVSDGMDSSRPWSPYAQLRATKPTRFDSERPVRSIRLTLDGDMQRYVWFVNNKPLSESDSIVVHKGEVVRFVMINRTMMHHPMHLHGHFFRVINDQGDYSPLKHTVDVAPMSTTVIEFAADEFGEWFFHCHLLYHMESGMARTVHYEGYVLPPAVQNVRSALYHDAWYPWVDGQALSNMTSGAMVYANTRNILVGEWEVGWKRTPVTSWEGILTWRRYFNRFFTVFVGGDFYGAKGERTENYAIVGFNYLLPLNIDTRVWLTHDASARVEFGKELVLIPRLAVTYDGEYDTNTKRQEVVRTTYMVNGQLSISGQWHSEYGWGGGLALLF